MCMYMHICELYTYTRSCTHVMSIYAYRHTYMQVYCLQNSNYKMFKYYLFIFFILFHFSFSLPEPHLPQMFTCIMMIAYEYFIS